ncbi:MAG: long-chain fatty acid--CoA ligase [Candidatus Eisenbacteria bacterium]
MPRTLIQIFLDTADRHDKPAQFLRKTPAGWEAIPARQAVSDVESLGLGLVSLGVGRGDRVALLSENRYEWAVSDLATLGIGAVTVPIYPTLTAQQVRYILENSEAKVCIVSTPAQYDKIVQIADTLPHLRVILAMEPAPVLSGRGQSFAQLIATGLELREREPRAFRQAAALVKPDDMATIIYTSGTTGDPKGAMLSHANVASNVEAGLDVVQLNASDTSLSFLPLCHIFERMAGMYCMLAAGVTIAYAQSLDTVAADAMKVHPTVLTGVPRFYEKVYARVMENAMAQPALRKNIFFWGLHVGIAVARLHFQGRKPTGWLALQHAIADKLVGAKVRARVGGKLRFCISGGAPLSPKVMEFFFAVGIPICEGYGLTETSPVICLNPPGRERPGAVGPVVPGVEVRIGDEGEILTRGPHVMMGYFRNDEATRAAIRDGWFHTGDVGHLDDDGYLFITDRLKDLLVTAGGKKVAPQPYEGRLKMSKWISEAVMLGDHRPYCIGLLVPNFSVLEHEARVRGWAHNNRRELLAHPDALALYQREVDKLNADLAPFEQIKKFALLDRDLSQDAGELTPTLKVRRRVITQKFAELIESLYAPAQ